MSARSPTKVTNTTQADTAAKTSLLKHSGVKPVEVEPKRKHEEWAKKNSDQKSCFKQDFSRVSVSTLSVPVIQPKLVVGQPDDRYEQEADQVAEQVMLMPKPGTVPGLDCPSGAAQPLSIQRLKSDSTKKLQRQVEESEESEEEETVQAKFLPSLSIHLLNSGSGERIQRQADELQEAQADEEEPIQAKFLSSLPIHSLNSSGERLQRQVDELQEAKPEEEEEEEAVQAKGVPHRLPTVASDLASRLKASRGGGQPLPASTREFMESRFNHDFSQVRVHTDGQAHQLARGLNAQAFTFKQDVYFGAGYYQPHTSSGKRLLAHELTHTIQQQDTLTLQSHQPDASPLVVNQPTDMLKHEAESVAHQVEHPAPLAPVTVSEGIPAAQNLISLRRSGSQATRSLTFSLNASVAANVGANLKPSSKRSSNKNTKPESEIEPEAKQDSEKEDAAPIEEAEAAKSATAEKDAAKSDETLADTTLPEASQQTPTSPDEDPAFQATLKQINQTKRTQRKHSPPDTKLGEVKAAAVLPENEQKDKNDRKQHLETIAKTAETVDKEKKAFKPETFKQLLQQNLKAIENHLPQDEAGARQFKHDKPLEKVKENIGQQVASENDKVAAPITGQVKQDPPDSKVPTKAATALQEAPIGSKPKPLDPQAAVPKPKHDSEISMEEESQKLDAKLSENKMTEEQLENSGEDKFKKTLETKHQAQQEAKAAPQRYRQEEENVLAGAEKKAQGAGKEQFGAMVGDRQGAFDTVYSEQVTTEKASTDKQKEVFKGLETFYNQTKDNVSYILTWLSEEVDRIFSEESEQAKKVFEDTVEEKLDDIHGLGIVEFFAGEDTGAIEQVFKEEKNKFLSTMDKTLDKIANLIAKWLNEAIQWIEHGRSESEKLFNGLDKDQQEKSRDAMELFRGQYDDLETSVNEKQNELAQTLAESYKSNVDSLRETFNKINEEVKKSWIDKAIEFIEEVASAIAKLADLLQSILQRVAELIGDILAHPIRFLENLSAGVKAGFDKFIAGIEGHLVGGFFDWLRGSMGGAGITIPEKLDAAGIFSLVMQVIGLGYDEFRILAVKILGKEETELLEKGAGAAEKGLEIFQLIQGKSLIALWEHLKEMIASSFDSIIKQVKETVLFETVKKALAFIGSLFTPAGAFIKAVQLLYKGLRFLVDNIDRIRELVNAFMDSIEMAVRGNSGGIASRIVEALKNFIVLAIDFLAKLLGLGDLAQKVRKIFQAIRKPIERAIEWLLKKVKPIVKRVFKKVKGLVKKVKAGARKVKKKVKAVAEKLMQWWKAKKNFKGRDGKNHQLFLKGSKTSATLMLASQPETYFDFIKTLKIEKGDPEALDAKNNGKAKAEEIDQESKRKLVGATKEEKKADSKKKKDKIEKLLAELAPSVAVLLGIKPEELPKSVVVYQTTLRDGSVFALITEAKILSREGEPGSKPKDTNPVYKDLLLRKEGNGTYYVRGHMLNENIHGPGVLKNLTPLSQTGNKNHLTAAEKSIKIAVLSGAVVRYTIDAKYAYSVSVPSDDELQKAGVDQAEWENIKKVRKAENNVPKGLTLEADLLKRNLEGEWVKDKALVSGRGIANPVDIKLNSYKTVKGPVEKEVGLKSSTVAELANNTGLDSDVLTIIQNAARLIPGTIHDINQIKKQMKNASGYKEKDRALYEKAISKIDNMSRKEVKLN